MTRVLYPQPPEYGSKVQNKLTTTLVNSLYCMNLFIFFLFNFMRTVAANIDCIILYTLPVHVRFQIFANVLASWVVIGMVSGAAYFSASVTAGRSFYINFMTISCTISHNWFYILLFSEQVANNACSVTLRIQFLCGCHACSERTGTCDVLQRNLAQFSSS